MLSKKLAVLAAAAVLALPALPAMAKTSQRPAVHSRTPAKLHNTGKKHQRLHAKGQKHQRLHASPQHHTAGALAHTAR